MNGDISVDIEPIYRTTGHKSAAFVGGYNTQKVRLCLHHPNNPTP
jgi:hypothetical protein